MIFEIMILIIGIFLLVVIWKNSNDVKNYRYMSVISYVVVVLHRIRLFRSLKTIIIIPEMRTLYIINLVLWAIVAISVIFIITMDVLDELP